MFCGSAHIFKIMFDLFRMFSIAIFLGVMVGFCFTLLIKYGSKDNYSIVVAIISLLHISAYCAIYTNIGT